MTQFKDFEKLMKSYPSDNMYLIKITHPTYGCDMKFEMDRFNKDICAFVGKFAFNPKENRPLKIFAKTENDINGFLSKFANSKQYKVSKSRGTNQYLCIPVVSNETGSRILTMFISKAAFKQMMFRYAHSTWDLIYDTIKPLNQKKLL